MRSAIPSAMTATPSSWPLARRLIIEPTIVSTTSARSNFSPRNSSGITASVAPADLHMPSARDPDFRPIEIVRYHLLVVFVHFAGVVHGAELRAAHGAE